MASVATVPSTVSMDIDANSTMMDMNMTMTDNATTVTQMPTTTTMRPTTSTLAPTTTLMPTEPPTTTATPFVATTTIMTSLVANEDQSSATILTTMTTDATTTEDSTAAAAPHVSDSSGPGMLIFLGAFAAVSIAVVIILLVSVCVTASKRAKRRAAIRNKINKIHSCPPCPQCNEPCKQDPNSYHVNMCDEHGPVAPPLPSVEEEDASVLNNAVENRSRSSGVDSGFVSSEENRSRSRNKNEDSEMDVVNVTQTRFLESKSKRRSPFPPSQIDAMNDDAFRQARAAGGVMMNGAVQGPIAEETPSKFDDDQAEWNEDENKDGERANPIKNPEL